MTTLAVPHFNILTFPLGGAQRALDRVGLGDRIKRMFGSPMGDGAFVQPMGGAGEEEAATLGLKTNLVAWWALDEESGNALDSHTNGLTLTDNNTVTSAVGVGGVGTSRLFNNSNVEYFSRASETLLQTGNINWAGCAWVYREVGGFQTFIFAKDDVGSNREFTLGWESGANDIMTFRVFNGSSPVGTLNSSVGVAVGAWHFLMWWCSVTDSKVYFSVDNGTPSEVALSGTPAAGTSAFLIGARSGVETYNGRLAKIGFWKNFTPTVGNVTDLYNSGAGRIYSEL